MPAHRTLAQKWGSEPKQKGPRKPGRKPSGIDMTATSLRLSTAQLAAMDWSEDPARVLDHLYMFGPADTDIDE